MPEESHGMYGWREKREATSNTENTRMDGHPRETLLVQFKNPITFARDSKLIYSDTIREGFNGLFLDCTARKTKYWIKAGIWWPSNPLIPPNINEILASPWIIRLVTQISSIPQYIVAATELPAKHSFPVLNIPSQRGERDINHISLVIESQEFHDHCCVLFFCSLWRIFYKASLSLLMILEGRLVPFQYWLTHSFHKHLLSGKPYVSCWENFLQPNKMPF